jgi:hypothetical protein
VRLTGWTLDQIDAAPAMTLDWMLACDRAAATAAQRRADADTANLEREMHR